MRLDGKTAVITGAASGIGRGEGRESLGDEGGKASPIPHIFHPLSTTGLHGCGCRQRRWGQGAVSPRSG